MTMLIDFNFDFDKCQKEKFPLRKMSIVDFDCLKVTTMTVIVKMIGKVNIEQIFPLLNITRLKLPPTIRQTKKYKIPYCGVPGAILSAKFKDVTRGIVKSKSKRSFLNSITIDICTSEKNINAKLSGEIIQMCGPDSENLARETAQHIIDHLLDLQKELNYINEDEDARDNAIEWLKNNSIGQDYIVDEETQEIIELNNGEIINSDGIVIGTDGNPRLKEKEIKFEHWHEGDFVTANNLVCNINKESYIILTKNGPQKAILNTNFFIKIEPDTKGNQVYTFVGVDEKPITIAVKSIIKALNVKSIIIPTEYPSAYPEEIDSRIVNFYIRYAPDFAYHHVYCQFLDSVKTIEHIASEDLAINTINMAMVNYSYSLGMSIDRYELARNINDLNGFKARYCNSTDHSVTISLPYTVPDEEKVARRKNKATRHTFTVHKSGIVTQSGPNIDMMREAYYRFMTTIMQIRHLIIQENKPFNLKYRTGPKQITDNNNPIPIETY